MNRRGFIAYAGAVLALPFLPKPPPMAVAQREIEPLVDASAWESGWWVHDSRFIVNLASPVEIADCYMIVGRDGEVQEVGAR